ILVAEAIYKERVTENYDFFAIPASMRLSDDFSLEIGPDNPGAFALYKNDKMTLFEGITKYDLESVLSIMFHEAKHRYSEIHNKFPYQRNILTGTETEIFEGKEYTVPILIPPSNHSANELSSYALELGMQRAGYTNPSPERIDKILEDIDLYLKSYNNAMH